MFELEIEKIEKLLSKQSSLFYEVERGEKSVILSFIIDDTSTIDYISKIIDLLKEIETTSFTPGYKSQVNVFKNQFYEWILEVEFVKSTEKTYPTYTPPTYNIPAKKEEDKITDTTGLEVTEEKKREFVLKSISQEISSTELLFMDDTIRSKNDDLDGPIYGGSSNYYYWKSNTNVLNIMKYRNNIYVISYFYSFNGRLRYFICYGISDIARLPIR
jgi:hypothetical protein